MTCWDPWAFSGTISFPVYEILKTSIPAAWLEDTADSGPLSMSQAEGGGLEVGSDRDCRTGLTKDTLNAGWTLMDLGRAKRTATVFTTLGIGKGPTKLCACFLLSTLNGRSLMESQTFWPTWNWGAGILRLLTVLVYVATDLSSCLWALYHTCWHLWSARYAEGTWASPCRMKNTGGW